jgi:hypothetical protein
MSIFEKKTASMPTKADAVAQLRTNVDVAIGLAQQAGVASWQIVEILEGQVAEVNQRAAMSAPSTARGSSIEHISELLRRQTR